MALSMFDIGYSKSDSKAQESGTSSSFGEADASSFDNQDSASDSQAVSGGSSFGIGSTFGTSQSRSSVFGADIFKSLFSGASNVAGTLADGAGGLSGAANGLFDSGMSFLSELTALSGEGPAGAGEDYLTKRLGGGGDALLNDQIQQVKDDLSSFYGEQLAPQIRREAIAGGGLGGDRQGVAEGIAGKSVLSELARSVTSLRSNDMAARDSAATTLAGLQASRRLTAAGTGVAALPGQLDLLAGGSTLALQPYLALSQILGSPTVLSESDALNTGSELSGSDSSSSSSSTSRSTGRAGSTSRSREGSNSQYSSSSSNKQRSYNLGLG